MDLKQIYFEVKSKMKQIDFGKIWKGFSEKKFALYTMDKCFFNEEYIEKTDTFIANTAIQYEGEFIAIWNLMEEMDLDILTSKMIHEMFHAFQQENNESRFPDEIKGLKDYSYEAQALTIKLLEDQLLVSLMENFDNANWEKLKSYRALRKKLFPADYEFEAGVEQIEGSATFVELAVLKELNKEKYLAKLKKVKSKITEPKNFFPIRIISYDIGALLFLLAKEAGENCEAFDSEPFSYSLTRGAPASLPPVDNKIENLVLNDKKTVEEKISTIIKTGKKVFEGKEKLAGVNVYNARYFNQWIFSEYFVAYGNIQAPTFLHGNFAVKTDEEYNILEIYQQGF